MALEKAGGYRKLKKVIFPENIQLDLLSRKKVLILGSGSYIGEKFKTYLEQWPDSFEVDIIGTMNGNWKYHDFSEYDVVYDVAGIAHVKESKKNHDLYFKVNRDLAIDAAKKAKSEGVKMFIYLSSIAVYGLNIGKINTETPTKPVNAYGKSKLQAESGLATLCDENFHVAVVRPPMVYGKGCKGNYQLLRKFVLKVGVFPAYDNERSSIFIDNLSSAIRGIMQYGESGIYLPQNVQYINTREMVEAIAKYNHKKLHEIKFLNPIIKIISKSNGTVQKVFGDYVSAQSTNIPTGWIDYKDNGETFRITESNEES